MTVAEFVSEFDLSDGGTPRYAFTNTFADEHPQIRKDGYAAVVLGSCWRQVMLGCYTLGHAELRTTRRRISVHVGVAIGWWRVQSYRLCKRSGIARSNYGGFGLSAENSC